MAYTEFGQIDRPTGILLIGVLSLRQTDEYPDNPPRVEGIILRYLHARLADEDTLPMHYTVRNLSRQTCTIFMTQLNLVDRQNLNTQAFINDINEWWEVCRRRPRPLPERMPILRCFPAWKHLDCPYLLHTSFSAEAEQCGIVAPTTPEREE